MKTMTSVVVTLVLTTILASMLAAGAPSTAHAQSGQYLWDAPFCGEQPPITALYDHELPIYSRTGHNGETRRADVLTYNNYVVARPYSGHNGWDYARRARNWRIYSADSGTVASAGWSGDDPAKRGYGLVLQVDHRANEQTLYGHMSVIFKEQGDSVGRGEHIGTPGNTGCFDAHCGPHLHFTAGRPDTDGIAHSFDPYGWNADWRGLADLPLPPGADPWYRASTVRSHRRLTPSAPGNKPCPNPDCGSQVVDDSDPGFKTGCASGGDYWHVAGNGTAVNGSYHYTLPNGASEDCWAQWTSSLPAGQYEVEVWVPRGDHPDSHAARYNMNGRKAILDQGREGNVWLNIGIYNFSSAPYVRLSDRTQIGGYTETYRHGHWLGADAVRFRRICNPG